MQEFGSINRYDGMFSSLELILCRETRARVQGYLDDAAGADVSGGAVGSLHGDALSEKL